MSFSDLPLHEQLASDEYWSGYSQEAPKPSFKAAMIDEFGRRSAAVMDDIDKRLVTVASGEHETIPEYQQLPILARAEPMIVKVTQDMRWAPLGRTPLNRIVRWQETPEAFDELAAEMVGTPVYVGRSALLRLEKDGAEIGIARHVSYMQGSLSGQQLWGLPSYRVGKSHLVDMMSVMPQLAVGVNYVDSRGNHSRIIAASLLKPLGSGPPRLRERAVKTRRSWGWLPRLGGEAARA